MKRENGYYWVKLQDSWCIRYWLEETGWILLGVFGWLVDSEMDEINETRLTPPK